MQNIASPFELITTISVALIGLGAATYWILAQSRRGDLQSQSSELQIYKDQLNELSVEHAIGRIDAADLANARLEIGHRLSRLKQSDNPNPLIATNPKLGIFLVLAFGTIALFGYFAIGSIGAKDMPFKGRAAELLSRPPQTLSQNEVLVLLQQRAKSDPRDPIAHLLIGKLLAGEGRDDEALRAIQASLRRDPQSAEALAELGGILFRLNDNQASSESGRALSAALQLEPQNLTAIFYRGQILWKSGKKNDALDLWQAAWAALPSDDLRREGLIIRVLNEISTLEIGPNMGDAANVSQTENPGDRIAAMVQRRTERLSQNPSDIGLRLSLARVFMMSGDSEKAAELLEAGKMHTKASLFQSAMLEEAKQSINPDN